MPHAHCFVQLVGEGYALGVDVSHNEAVTPFQTTLHTNMFNPFVSISHLQCGRHHLWS